jgi:hypothetical protein
MTPEVDMLQIKRQLAFARHEIVRSCALREGRLTMTTHQQMKVRRSISARHLMILALVGMGLAAQPSFAANAGNGSLALSVPAATSAKRGVETQIKDLQPFTHFASIPATSNAGTIKFERVKTTKVFTKVKSTMDPGYCDDLQFRDPGGSMYCPYTQDESPAPAYEVIYSFKGEPLASDEYGNRNFTFEVYFHPEELPPALRKEISTGKVKRAELATYFNLTTSRLPVRAAVIDEANSRFCGGNYMDGNWIHNDPKCQDKVSYKTVTMPSDYITVQVEPGSPRLQ